MAGEDSTVRIKGPAPTGKPEDLFGPWTPDLATEKGYKVLLYGASGSGKTYMAGTFPDPLFVDLEDGMRTLLPLKRNILRYPKNPAESITEWKQVKRIYNAIKNLNPAQAPFKTIVIDSLNELQVLLMKNILSTIDTNRIYEDQPTQGDYGKLARDMQAVVREFLQLPYNVVMIATATDSEYEGDKIYPLFVGKKTGPDLRRIIEQIGYCYTQQRNKDAPVEYMVSFNDNPAYLAKDRTGKLKRPISNNFQAMVAESTKGESK